jgi:hypothetical protein
MAHIGLDLARRLGPVDPRIFGQFIEHLGRCAAPSSGGRAATS